MESLKTHCQIQNSVDMEIKSGRMTPKFEFEVTLRTPIGEKEYTTVPKQVIRITKAYPEFNKDATSTNQNNQSSLAEKRNKANEISDKDVSTKKKPAAPVQEKPAEKKPEEKPANNTEKPKFNQHPHTPKWDIKYFFF